MKCLLNYVEVIRTHRKSGKYLIYILLIPNFYTFEYTYIHETQCLGKKAHAFNSYPYDGIFNLSYT